MRQENPDRKWNEELKETRGKSERAGTKNQEDNRRENPDWWPDRVARRTMTRTFRLKEKRVRVGRRERNKSFTASICRGRRGARNKRQKYKSSRKRLQSGSDLQLPPCECEIEAQFIMENSPEYFRVSQDSQLHFLKGGTYGRARQMELTPAQKE